MTRAVAAVSLALSIAFLTLAVWRIRTRPPGQWLAMAGIAATLVALNAADWLTGGSAWSALRALIAVVMGGMALVGFVLAADRAHTAAETLQR